MIVPLGRSGHVAMFEIEDASNAIVGAVRHQIEDDYASMMRPGSLNATTPRHRTDGGSRLACNLPHRLQIKSLAQSELQIFASTGGTGTPSASG
jgi:hypothetical protein